jgi:hypothetical protein
MTWAKDSLVPPSAARRNLRAAIEQIQAQHAEEVSQSGVLKDEISYYRKRVRGDAGHGRRDSERLR